MDILLYYGHSKEKEQEMQVYSLVGYVDYEGSDLLGVFGSLEDLMQFYGQSLSVRGFHQVGYIVSELGQGVDVYRDVVYL